MAITKASSNAVAPAAKGDLVAGTTTNDSGVLAVGANGTVLTAASGQATGLEWATPSSGAYTTLASGNLSSTSVSLTSISQSYKDLVLVLDNPYVNVLTGLAITCNSYTTANHYYNALIGSTSGATADSSATLFRIDANLPVTSAGVYSYWTFPNYTQARQKIVNATYRLTSAGSNNRTMFFGNLDTAAISSIQIKTENGTSTFSGGTYILYGVK